MAGYSRAIVSGFGIIIIFKEKFNDMKRFLLAAFLVALICPAFAQYDPVADPAAQVVAGNARFTVLTDRMIRMEWSPEARFEDHATLAIVNRKLPVPRYTVKRSGDGVTITTGALTLVYVLADGVDLRRIHECALYANRIAA